MIGLKENPIVELATLAEITRDLTIKDYFDGLGQMVRKSYQNDRSVLKAVKEVAVYDTLLAIAGMTYIYSKFKNKIPEKMQPTFVRYSVPGMAADLLATYHGR